MILEHTAQNGEMGVASLYTPETLAARLGVALKTIRKWDASRRIPGRVKLGRLVRFDRAAIEKRIVQGSVLLEATR